MTERTPDSILEAFNGAKTIAFLTGAGVSTDSGIPDFQTVDEAWPFDRSRAEVTNINYFKRDPRRFWEAFRYLFTLKTSVEPNSFHRAVADLEKRGKEVIVLTQNVDGLHGAAGSTQVGELHGNIRQVICSRPSCKETKTLEEVAHEEVPRCKCGKFFRPDTVLFGENPRFFGDAKDVCLAAGLLVVAGTALDVGPVNDLPRYRDWYYPEAPTLWMNRDPAPFGYHFSHSFEGELSAAVELLEEVGREIPLPSLG